MTSFVNDPLIQDTLNIILLSKNTYKRSSVILFTIFQYLLLYDNTTSLIYNWSFAALWLIKDNTGVQIQGHGVFIPLKISTPQ